MKEGGLVVGVMEFYSIFQNKKHPVCSVKHKKRSFCCFYKLEKKKPFVFTQVGKHF